MSKYLIYDFELDLLFIHNWRCAGTSLHSVLSASLGDKYLKIGCRFNRFGWPDQSKPEIIRLRELRKESPRAFGGHLFWGIDNLVGGSSRQTIVSLRDPMERMKSGVYRFMTSNRRTTEASLFKGINVNSQPIDLSERELKKLADKIIGKEYNGIARRLSGISAADKVSLTETTNIEEINWMEQSKNEMIMKKAKENLQGSHILQSDNFWYSIIKIENELKKDLVLINPFSPVKHNSYKLVVDNQDESGTERMYKILEEHLRINNKEDIDLYNYYKVRRGEPKTLNSELEQRIKTRELIHKRPLFAQNWFNSGLELPVIDKLIAGSISARAKEDTTIDKDMLVDTVLRWNPIKNRKRFIYDALT